MSREVIQGIVSEMADAFIAAGLADTGTYTAPGQDPVPCRVFINRNSSPQGDFGSVPANKTSLTLLLSEISQPKRDALVVADGQTFRLVRATATDDAVTTWDVTL